VIEAVEADDGPASMLERVDENTIIVVPILGPDRSC